MMLVYLVILLLSSLCLFSSLVQARNTHGLPDQVQEQQAYWGDTLSGYVVTGCLHATSGTTSAVIASCKAYGKDTSTARLEYVEDTTARTVTYAAGDGTYWLIIHASVTEAVGGWTRVVGTHYLWQLSATQPALPSRATWGAQSTVSGSAITAVADFRIPVSYVLFRHYDITDALYGAVADDSTNVGPALQAAINAAGTQKGGKVYIPRGRFHQSTAVTIDTTGVTIEGEEWEPQRIDGSGQPGQVGSWLTYRNTDTGFVPFTIRKNGIVFRHMAFDHDQPAPAPGWTPHAYQYVIEITQPIGLTEASADIILENLFFYRATRGIRQYSTNNNSSGRLFFSRIYGQIFQTGILFEYITDTVRVHHVHFWPYWNSGADVRAYSQSNFTGIETLRNDNPIFTNLFIFDYFRAIRVGANGFGTTVKMLVSHSGFDNGKIGLYVDGANSSGQLINTYMQGEDTAGGSATTGTLIAAAGAAFTLTDVRFDFYDDQCIRVDGASVIAMTNILCNGWNQLNAGHAAVRTLNGGSVMAGGPNRFLNGLGGAAEYAGTFLLVNHPGGVGFSGAGDFNASMVGGFPTFQFRANGYLQLNTTTGLVSIVSDALYTTGGNERYLCIEDGVLFAAAECNEGELLTLNPIVTAPATCVQGQLYFDSSGAVCACTSTNTWTNISGVGTCS